MPCQASARGLPDVNTFDYQTETWTRLSDMARGRWYLVAAALGANALPLLLLGGLWIHGAILPTDPSMITMHVVLVQINIVTFGAAVLAIQGNVARLYSFPVATSALVTWHLLLAMAAMAIESAASIAALNALFQLDWPLWGPALFAAVALAAVQATLWHTENSAWLPCAMAVVGGGLGVWLKSRYGAPLAQPQHFWIELTPGEVTVMLAIAVLVYGVAIRAVARNRRGDRLGSLGITAWLTHIFDPAPDVGLSFRTAAQAQFWLEWRIWPLYRSSTFERYSNFV